MISGHMSIIFVQFFCVVPVFFADYRFRVPTFSGICDKNAAGATGEPECPDKKRRQRL